MTVLLAPGFSEPTLHGNAVVQSPVFDTKVRPGGVGSASMTFCAVDGPSLVTPTTKVTMPGGVTDSGPDLLAMRSADAAIVVMSVEVLLEGSGSVVPAGGATVAVFVRTPLAVGDTVAVTVKVTDPPRGSDTVVSMFPVPDPPLQDDRVAAMHDQETLVSSGGNVSRTAAPTTSLGPRLDTVIVYVTVFPANTVSRPSVFVMARSATDVAVTEALAMSLL